MIEIVRRNYNIEELHIVSFTRSSGCVTDALVEAIAESCPNLRTLFLSEGPSVPTEHVVVKLAQGCPKLRSLFGCSGPGITDLSVLALAAHCRHLQYVRLHCAAGVTENALRQLVERTCVQSKIVLSFIDKEMLGRLQQAEMRRNQAETVR